MPRRKKSRRSNRKDGVRVLVGNITYQIIKTENGLKCPCGLSCHNDSPCPHIKALLMENNVHELLVPMYKKLSKLICEHIRKDTFKEKILEKIEEELDKDCGFCCNELYRDPKREKWVICENCNGMTHLKCYLKWETQKKGCMYCRYGVPEAKPKDNNSENIEN